MTKYIITYFLQFGQIDIPGVGSLQIIKKEAEFTNGIIHAPSEMIHFEKGNYSPNKQFYSYLSSLLDISNEQATIQYEQYCSTNFADHSRITLGNLGSLELNNKEYTWVSNFKSSDYLKNIDVSSLPNAQFFEDAYTNKQKDKWWVWAIILGIIALIAILNKL